MRVGESGGASAAWMLQRLFQSDGSKASSTTETNAGRQNVPSEKGGPSNAAGGAGPMMSGGMMSAMVSMQTQPSSESAASDAASELLSALDTDGDGEVSAEELAAAFSEAGIDTDASEALAKLDGDSSGSLNADELKTAISSDMAAHKPHGGPPPGGPPPGGPPPSAEDGANWLISALDEDEDGGINLSEVATALGQDEDSDSLSQAFASLDSDGDGVLSAGELTSAIQVKMDAAMKAYTQQAALV